MLLRLILPVVKACPPITTGDSHSTSLTFCLAISRRSSIPKSLKSPGARPTVALAEIVLAAGIHRDVGWQVLAVLVEKSEQAAPMIEMAVAQDQRVDPGRVDLEQIHVAVDRLGRPTIIQQEGAFVVAALRLQQQRQPPFAVQRAQRLGGAAGLGADAVHGLRPKEKVAGAVDQDTDGEPVDSSARRSGLPWPSRRRKIRLPRAASAKLADIFKASRRLKSGMAFLAGLGRNGRENLQFGNYRTD